MLITLLASCDKKEPEKKEDPAPDVHAVSVWVAHGFDKLRTESTAPENAKTEHTVYVAKNESEGVHIGIRSDSHTGLSRFVMLSGENENISCSYYQVKEILNLDGKQWTDPLAQIDPNKRFRLTKDETMAVYVDFKTTSQTPAGEYDYEFALIDSNNNVMGRAKITVHVWDFAMPKELTFQSAVGNTSSNKIFPEDVHYEMLLEHNLSGYRLPVDILSDEADEYMSNPRVTSFEVPVPKNKDNTIDTEKIRAYRDKLITDPVWLEKAYFYPIDEPSDLKKLGEFENICKQLRELCPEIKITVPYYKNVQVTPELDQIDFMDQYVDLHCPKLASWNDDVIYSEEQKAKYPSFAERMKALQKKDETVWTYVCNYPLAPYLNVKVNDEGIVSRVLFWQFYQRDIEGFLYWHSSYYSQLGNGGDPWKSVDTFGNGIYGDGILLYTGNGIGLPKTTPVPSIRLKIIRDGIDDIELLYMAEELFGREWVDERANKVSKSLTTVDVTSDELAALRIEIGNAIEKELNK